MTLSYVASQIETPLIPILARMTRHGALVDKAFVRGLKVEVGETLDSLRGALEYMAPGMDPMSNPSVGAWLFGPGGCRPTRFNKTGPVVDKFVLEDLDHPVASLIREYRKAEKLMGTYIEPILAQPTDRVHGKFNQYVTRTGRLSSSGPNLQNQDKRIRAAYVAPEGGALLCGDYGQQELRVLAHYSRDPEWLRWFQEGRDPHEETAVATGVSRGAAKILNFGIPYGAGAKTMGKGLPGGQKQAAQLLEMHRATYPTLWAWIDWYKDLCREKGYAETIWGRRRWLPGLQSELPDEVWKAERDAVNMPIQGSSADITKLAMVRIDRVLEDPAWSGITMILQVHDELVLECRTVELAERFKPVMEEVMVGVGRGKMDVPLVVDAHWGKTWKDAK